MIYIYIYIKNLHSFRIIRSELTMTSRDMMFFLFGFYHKLSRWWYPKLTSIIVGGIGFKFASFDWSGSSTMRQISTTNYIMHRMCIGLLMFIGFLLWLFQACEFSIMVPVDAILAYNEHDSSFNIHETCESMVSMIVNQHDFDSLSFRTRLWINTHEGSYRIIVNAHQSLVPNQWILHDHDESWWIMMSHHWIIRTHQFINANIL